MNHKQRIEKLESTNNGKPPPRLVIYDPKDPDRERPADSKVAGSVTIYLPDNGRDQ